MVMIVLALAGSVLIGNDFRYGSLPFYLSKPLSRRHYLLGKGLAVAVFINLLTTLPALALFVEYGLIYSWDHLIRNSYLVVGILAYGAVLTVSLTLDPAGDGGLVAAHRAAYHDVDRFVSPVPAVGDFLGRRIASRPALAADRPVEQYLVGGRRLPANGAGGFRPGQPTEMDRSGLGPGRSEPGMSDLSSMAAAGGGNRGVEVGRDPVGSGKTLSFLVPGPSAPVLLCQRVSKWYGPVIGVNQVTLELRPGITGLVGSNGAGKSTLMRLITGHLRPDIGRVEVLGLDAWSAAAKRHIGYCPEVDTFYEEMSGRQFVETMARLSGYSSAEARRRTDSVLERVGMSGRAERRLRGYSKGMRQRIKLAQALLTEPQLLVLDEPLSGIDPVGRGGVYCLVPRTGRTGQMSARLQPRTRRIAKADRSRGGHGARTHRRRRLRGANPRPPR